MFLQKLSLVRITRLSGALLALTFALLTSLPAVAEGYAIGVYYYPGWSPVFKRPDHQPDPWQPIRAFPERQPELGWYRDDQVETVEKQLQWMSQYGISFVTFDWYWGAGCAEPETAVRAYLRAPSRAKVKYALLWANHFKVADAALQWDKMVDFWLQQHLQNPEYLRVDDQPVVFIFSGDFLRDNAAASGTSARALIDRAQAKARAAGLKGIHFVLGTPALEYWVKGFAVDAGFSALSAYNYHQGYAGSPASATRVSHSFRVLVSAYRMQWRWMLDNSKLPYFLPMTSGWDSRPWGGSKEDPLHDRSVSTPDEFEAHLRAAKSMMDAHPEKTRKMGIICCWNEFGEGSYIEPTKGNGFGYLERIRAVFGKRP